MSFRSRSPLTNPAQSDGADFSIITLVGVDILGRLHRRTSSEAIVPLRERGAAGAPLIGGETILAEGKVVGTTTSAGYGYTVGKTIALGYLPAEIAKEAELSIEAYGKNFSAKRAPRSLYDPKGERLRS